MCRRVSVDQERTLQNVKIVVDGFCAELSPLTFKVSSIME